MLKAFGDFFAGLWETICNVVDFFISLVEDIAKAVQYLTSSGDAITDLTEFLPAAFFAFFILALSIFIVMRVVNRTN